MRVRSNLLFLLHALLAHFHEISHWRMKRAAASRPISPLPPMMPMQVYQGLEDAERSKPQKMGLLLRGEKLVYIATRHWRFVP